MLSKYLTHRNLITNEYLVYTKHLSALKNVKYNINFPYPIKDSYYNIELKNELFALLNNK